MGACPLDRANSTIGSRLTIFARRFGNSSSKKAPWQIHLKDRVQGGMRILPLAYWHGQTDRRIAQGRADLQVRGCLHWKAFCSLRLYNVLTEEKGKLHETKIVQLAPRFPRAFIKPVHFSSQKLQAFNCFMHVLNLVDRVEPNVFRQDDKTLNFFIDSSFFRKLYDADVVSKTSIYQLEPNDLVVYYNGQQKMHVGRNIAPNLVESKWGIGPLFRHGLWDV
jgi:hypothetical protein